MAKCSEGECSRSATYTCATCGQALCWEHYVPAPDHGGALCLECAFKVPGLLAGLAERIANTPPPLSGDPEVETDDD